MFNNKGAEMSPPLQNGCKHYYIKLKSGADFFQIFIRFMGYGWTAEDR